MSTVNIDRKALKAVSRFQSTKDIRYYLNGVCVKSNATRTVIIATDGHTIALHKGDWKDENVGEVAELIIPTAAVKTMLSWKLAKYAADVVTVTVPDDLSKGGQCQAQNGDNIVCFKPIDGKFPDFTRVIPKEVSGEAGHYNAEYLLRCQQAAEDFAGRKGKNFASIGQNGNSAAVATVSASDSFVAVVMPMRVNNPVASEWLWALDPLAMPVDAVEPVAEA